ncbi:MAG: epoxide hydrolase family protein [Bacteroidota bacterium]
MKNKIFITLVILSLCFEIIAAQTKDPSAGFARPDLVRKFKIHVSANELQAVNRKVKEALLPPQMPRHEGTASDWETGMDMVWLKGLQDYWIKSFDWRKQESLLNSYPQYIADIDGYAIQFYFIQGEGKNPLPLILTHGWPGSTFEFFNVIEPLTHPAKYGGKSEDAFTLIIPALPGFGFSSMPDKPVNINTTAKLWHKLVTEIIGYKKYVAQGGDWGAGVTLRLGYLFPESVKAIHLNFFPGMYVPDSLQTDNEKKYFADIASFMIPGFDYWRIQADKPMIPAVALHDSPIGTAGWIAEKFWAWADHHGNLDSLISKDRLLTNIMLYIINGNRIDGSFWFYRGFLTEMKGSAWTGFIQVPTSVAKYPSDLPVSHPPIETVKRGYNLVRFTDMPKGGHFAAMEQPELFVDDIRLSFRAYHE